MSTSVNTTQEWMDGAYLEFLQDYAQEPEQVRQLFFQNPLEILGQYGITEELLAAGAMNSSGPATPAVSELRSADSGVTASTHWWGVVLTFDEPSTVKLEGGATMASGLGGVVSAALAPIPLVGQALAGIGAVIVGALVMEAAALQLADNGRGVHFNWTWAQIGLMTVPVINVASLVTMLIPIGN